MLIEFGNEMNLELNFMAQGLASAIEQSKAKGVIETAPCFASMLIHYDPSRSASTISRRDAGWSARSGSEIEIDSRLFYLGGLSRPWTKRLTTTAPRSRTSPGIPITS
jgi:urea carboxylase